MRGLLEDGDVAEGLDAISCVEEAWGGGVRGRRARERRRGGEGREGRGWRSRRAVGGGFAVAGKRATASEGVHVWKLRTKKTQRCDMSRLRRGNTDA